MGTSSSYYQEGSQIPVGVTVVVGPQGNDGAAVPIQTVNAAGAVVLDYSLGKHVVLNLVDNVTSFSITNWPAAGNLARLTVEVHNTGPYGITGFPGSYRFSNGHIVPVTTQGAGAEDWLAFTTTTAGTEVAAHNVGQNYS